MFTLLGNVQQQTDLNTSFKIVETVLKSLDMVEEISLPEKLIGSSVEEIQLFERTKKVFQDHDIPMPINTSTNITPAIASDSISCMRFD